MAEEEKKDVMTADEKDDAELHRDAETVKEERRWTRRKQNC